MNIDQLRELLSHFDEDTDVVFEQHDSPSYVIISDAEIVNVKCENEGYEPYFKESKAKKVKVLLLHG